MKLSWFNVYYCDVWSVNSSRRCREWINVDSRKRRLNGSEVGSMNEFFFPLNHALHIMHTTLFIYTKVHFFNFNVLFSCSTKPRLQWRLYTSCHNAALVVVCLFILLKSLSVLQARRIHRLIQFLVTLNTSSPLYWSCLWAVTWIMRWDGHLLCFTVAAIWIMTMQTILF